MALNKENSDLTIEFLKSFNVYNYFFFIYFLFYYDYIKREEFLEEIYRLNFFEIQKYKAKKEANDIKCLVNNLWYN